MTRTDSTADITVFHPDLLELSDKPDDAHLKGYRCTQCGALDFPRPDICPVCWNDRFEPQRLSRRGTLYSVTDIYVGQAGMTVPYVFGYVDLPEQLRIFAQLDGPPGSFACDDVVELVTGPIRLNRDGVPLLSYKFRKITATGGQ